MNNGPCSSILTIVFWYVHLRPGHPIWVIVLAEVRGRPAGGPHCAREGIECGLARGRWRVILGVGCGGGKTITMVENIDDMLNWLVVWLPSILFSHILGC